MVIASPPDWPCTVLLEHNCVWILRCGRAQFADGASFR